jgi:hypothetical protein
MLLIDDANDIASRSGLRGEAFGRGKTQSMSLYA